MRKDKLETILGREGISRRDLFKIGFVAAGNLLLPSYGCKKGGGGGPAPDPNPTPGNNAPVFNPGFQLPNAEEGEIYRQDISGAASDSDGPNSLTYSLQQNGIMRIENGTTLVWDNPDVDRIITIEADDGKDKTPKSFNIKVNQYDVLSGKVKDILSGAVLSGAVIFVGDMINGSFVPDSNLTIQAGPQGNYSIKLKRELNKKRYIKIEAGNYLEHLAGYVELSQDEAGVDFELIPTFTHPTNPFNMDFFNEITKGGNSSTPSQRWINNRPRIYLDIFSLVGFPNQTIPTNQGQIDSVERIIESELPNVINNYFQNIQVERGTGPIPIRGESNTIIVYWSNNSGGSGGTFAYKNNDNVITSAEFFITTTADERIISHEAFHSTGAIGHSNLEWSILNTTYLNPPRSPLPTTYQPFDFDAGEILYKRPPGNKSTPEAPDANPDTYRIR